MIFYGTSLLQGPSCPWSTGCIPSLSSHSFLISPGLLFLCLKLRALWGNFCCSCRPRTSAIKGLAWLCAGFIFNGAGVTLAAASLGGEVLTPPTLPWPSGGSLCSRVIFYPLDNLVLTPSKARTDRQPAPECDL